MTSFESMIVGEKAAYMHNQLSGLIQKYRSERLRPITYLEIETWFKYLEHCSLNCYVKYLGCKLKNSVEDDNIEVDYHDHFENCVLYFENNDIDYGTIYVNTEENKYAFPSIHFKWPSNIYVDDNDEEIIEIKEYIKNILAL